MSSASSAITGFSLMASLIVAIGAQNTFVLRQGLRREHVGAVISFCVTADVLLSSIGIAGLGAALGRVPRLDAVLTSGGTVFLAWYAATAARRAFDPNALHCDEDGGRLPLRGVLTSAAAFTFLNPHVYLDTVLFIGAVGAARPSGEHVYFLLGIALASFIWFSILGYGARLFAPVFSRPSAWRVLDALVAIVMGILAIGLFLRILPG